MARKILIFVGDDGALRQLGEALAPLEVELDAHLTAAAALAAFRAAPADLVVLDPAAPEGRRVASELQRASPGLPFVFLTRVDDPQVTHDVHPLPAGTTVSLPLRPEAVRKAVVAGLSSRLPPSGSLREKPMPVVLGELARGHATGRLEVIHGRLGRHVYLLHGRVVFAASNVPAESAGGLLVREGVIAAETFAEARDKARKRHLPLYGALDGIVDPRTLEDALSRQTREVVAACCGLPDGDWVFQPMSEPLGVPVTAQETLELVAEGVRRAYGPQGVRSWLQRRDGILRAAPALASERAAISRLPGGPEVLARIDAGTPVEVAARLPDDEATLVTTLAAFGLISAGTATSRTPATPRLGGEDKRRIDAEARRLETADHYRVLGVSPGASLDEIRQAYFAAARRWHADAFAGKELGESAQQVQRIFARVSEAHEVLSDAEKRAEYDVFLDRKAKGLPTDVAAVLEAESLFHKAQNLFRGQRWAEAEALFREAVRLNPAEAEFWAWLGAASHRARGAVQEARVAFARARALVPQSIVTEYLEAQVDLEEGDLEGAERRLRRILLEKPDHPEASRLLRVLRERKEKEAAAGRGLLGKLLNRK